MGRPFNGSRVCPVCGARKDYYAKTCRGCGPKPQGYRGLFGSAHPAWKGGTQIDRDGYLRTYDPAHPWPRRGGYVLEHVRRMELRIGRRILVTETVHHKDGDRNNNDLANLALFSRGEHSRIHRAQDTHLRARDHLGRFAADREVENV